MLNGRRVNISKFIFRDILNFNIFSWIQLDFWWSRASRSVDFFYRSSSEYVQKYSFFCTYSNLTTNSCGWRELYGPLRVCAPKWRCYDRNNSWNADTYETILAFFTHFFDAPFIVFIDQSIDTSQPKLWNVRFSSTVQFPSTRSVFKYCCLQSAQPFLVVLIAVSTHVFKVQLSASYNPVTLKLLRIVQPVSERDFRTIYGKHSSSIYQVNNLL